MRKIFLLLLTLISININAQKVKVDKKIANEACECTEKIDSKLKHQAKGDSIASCIQMVSIKAQIMEQMLSSNKDKKNIVIADKDFDIIQEYLLQNCPRVKFLLMTNDEVGVNTISENKIAKEFYNKGEKEFEKEDYKNAIKNFQKAVEIDPNFAFAWDNMGVSYRKLQKFNEAIDCYKKSLQIDPKGHMPLMNLAVAYEFLKNYQEANIAYKNFKNIYPEDPEGFYGMGRMEYILQDFESSLDNLLVAYAIYLKTNSPYIHHAKQMISAVYGELKKQKKEDFIKSMEEKHKIKFN